MKIKYLLAILGVILLIALSVLFFKAVAIFSVSDLSKSGNLGSAVSGLTSPAIGLLSIVLLYLALTKQNEANIEQRLKNDGDIIFALINQMDDELHRFYTKPAQTTNVEKDLIETGLKGLTHFTREYKFEYTKDLFESDGVTFKSFYESHLIILIINSFQLIEKRVEISSFPDEMKKLFQDKLDSYYQCKLRLPLKYLLDGFDKHDQSKQDYPKKIFDFVSTQKNEGNIFN